ncbi:MAG: benzoyl-CoA 2,3-epoxidase subunit BoxB, partial [Candidatus Binataceae bacterium]
GDTEPASVEQQRRLGATAPSLYDLRNLFQVNVEEARHLWAMVYLLQRFFGRDGREEAEELITRRSGDADHPRLLNAFNAPVRDWLDFFCFCMFTDRDGKYQLAALAESGFDPLARTTRFMLTEEAFHMFVGETGIQRIAQRSAELMKSAGRDDIFDLGGIPLAVLQKYINLWYSESLDLFGSEDSSNAANYFAAGLKARYKESADNVHSDHRALEGEYEFKRPDGSIERIPLRRAMNALLRDAYVEDCERALKRWNAELEKRGVDARLSLPARGFNRKIGVNVAMPTDPAGRVISHGEFAARREQWLPSDDDRTSVAALVKPVCEPGKIASWIAAPPRGVNGQPLDFKYVSFT